MRTERAEERPLLGGRVENTFKFCGEVARASSTGWQGRMRSGQKPYLRRFVNASIKRPADEKFGQGQNHTVLPRNALE